MEYRRQQTIETEDGVIFIEEITLEIQPNGSMVCWIDYRYWIVDGNSGCERNSSDMFKRVLGGHYAGT